ncbi:GntR family transcriptional regulator [Streptomyces sp. NPDC004783]|uniref:GntR family transcriptional regulator n=1 Tax=unclassified Streptomyces TaxID=2593676 RepID=UPI0033A6DB94
MNQADTADTRAGQALSTRDKVLAHLRENVLTDPDVQDTFLSEQAIADTVGVSRTPVREALVILASEDLVRLMPKRGVFVPAMTSRELTELFEIRGVLEKHAAQKIASLPGADLTELRQHLAHQQELADTTPHTPQNAREFIAADRGFHQALVALAGNRLATRTYTSLRDRQTRAGLLAVQERDSRWQEVCAEHTLIVQALEKGDAEAATAAIDRHLNTTLVTLLAQ